MSDPFISMVNMTAFNWAPVNNALCNGALLEINEHTALFSLIGTAFGGNGTTNFGLPDLRGRTPVGTGSWDVPYTRGLIGGEAYVTLGVAHLPPHTHGVKAMPTVATSKNLEGTAYAEVPPSGGSSVNSYSNSSASKVSLHPNALPTSAGSSQAHSNIQPHTAINFIIAIAGTYPQRN